MKTCIKCKVEKDFGFFYRHRSRTDGLSSGCKECVKKHNLNNKEKIAFASKSWYQNNKERVRLKNKEWRKNNKKKIYLLNKEYRLSNKEKVASMKRAYYLRDKEKNPHRIKNYRRDNRERINFKKNEYIKIRRKKDPSFAARLSARSIVNKATKLGYKKDSNTEAAIGCSYEEFKVHIELQFAEGMSWANRSEWHIDHIKPMAKLSDEKHLMTHHSNLQPLWAKDNLRKADSYVPK